MTGDAAILAAIDEAAPPPPPPDDAELARLERNDLGNAERLIARFGNELCFVPQVGWMAWDGTRWDADGGEFLALRRAQETSRAIQLEAAAIPPFDEIEPERPDARERWLARKTAHENKIVALRKWAVASGNQSKCTGMLAAATPALRRRYGEFDAKPYHLNMLNGTLRLDLAQRRANQELTEVRFPLFEHRQSDCLTKCGDASYDPDATCPQWDEFVAQVFTNAEDVAWYVQKKLGYAFFGSDPEQKIWIWHGGGSNGKSTLLEVFCRVLGDYAVTTPVAAFLHMQHKDGNAASPAQAEWPGARLIRTSEPEAGDRLNESLIKQTTGGEPMKARNLNKGFFEFKQNAVLIIGANILPTLVGKDFGIRRRIVVVPFRHQFKTGGRGPGGTVRLYADEMAKEASGILNWALRGFLGWIEEGLEPPKAITDATEAYFAEMDPIGQFLLEACEFGDDFTEGATDMYNAYKKWCEGREEPLNQTRFGRRLKDMGHDVAKSHGVKKRFGIRLKTEYRDYGV